MSISLLLVLQCKTYINLPPVGPAKGLSGRERAPGNPNYQQTKDKLLSATITIQG